MFKMQNQLKQITIISEKNVATSNKYILRKIGLFENFETPNTMFNAK